MTSEQETRSPIGPASTSPPTLRWERGGAAVIISLTGEQLVVISTVASAPGSRPIGTLSNQDSFRMKVHRCRRLALAPPAADVLGEGDRFQLDGRTIDATKELRQFIRAGLDSPSQ